MRVNVYAEELNAGAGVCVVIKPSDGIRLSRFRFRACVPCGFLEFDGVGAVTFWVRSDSPADWARLRELFLKAAEVLK